MPETGPYLDDSSITDDAALWRRVPPYHVVYDDNLGRYRPSSAAFEDHPDGSPMSVVLGDEVLSAGRSSDSVLAGHEGFSLASITAKLAREKQQGIRRDPLPHEPAHAEVFGKKTKSVRSTFSKRCEWVVPPSDVAGG